MKERRHSERIKCRFSCELVRAGKAIAATVVDISSGGLTVRGSEPGPTAGTPRTSPAKPADPVVTELAPFRIRLKHRASPRTRVLTVDASSRAEAREIAVSELGVECEILEARAGTCR